MNPPSTTTNQTAEQQEAFTLATQAKEKVKASITVIKTHEANIDNELRKELLMHLKLLGSEHTSRAAINVVQGLSNRAARLVYGAHRAQNAVQSLEDLLLGHKDDLPPVVAKACLEALTSCRGYTATYLVVPLLRPDPSEGEMARLPFFVKCPPHSEAFFMDLADTFSDNKESATNPESARKYFGGSHDEAVTALSQDLESIRSIFTDLPPPQVEETRRKVRDLAERWEGPESLGRFDDPALVMILQNDKAPENRLKTAVKPEGLGEMTGRCLSFNPEDNTASDIAGMVLLDHLSSGDTGAWPTAQSELVDTLETTKANVESFR